MAVFADEVVISHVVKIVAEVVNMVHARIAPVLVEFVKILWTVLPIFVIRTNINRRCFKVIARRQ